jgi:2-methylcitrate dehydratase PrpD
VGGGRIAVGRERDLAHPGDNFGTATTWPRPRSSTCAATPSRRARITVHTKDGRILEAEHLGYAGGLANPMSWNRVVEKFHRLSEAYADDSLRGRIIEAVLQLDARPISDLMDLLVQVHPTAVFPTTHLGIQ